VRCSECSVSEGTYTSSGGSEQQTQLTLLPDHAFTLTHESWQPGQYENRSISKTGGAWSCEKNQLMLKIDSDTYSAEFVSIGENPLGLDANSKALRFSADQEQPLRYLGNEILYLKP